MAANPVEMNQDCELVAQALPESRQRLTQGKPETQNAPDGSTELVQSTPKKHGGKRAGAGRKPDIERALAHPIKPVTAAMVLAQVDEFKLWKGLLKHPDARIRLDAAKYCTDRRDGKAKQAIEHLGPDGGPLQAAVLVKFVESEK